ncbi:MAG: HNH endonuclease [Prevotella sp.]|nr:HNH endonuclease [Prevotella sp.]
MRKFWTDKLDNLLRRYYPKGDLDALAERLGTTREAVKCRAGVLGIRRKVNVKKPWTERQLALLRKHYADMPIQDLEQKLHRKRDGIYNKAMELGLERSKEVIAEQGRRSSQHPKVVACRFKKGQEPANKGKREHEFRSQEGSERCRRTQFKPGQQPANTKPVGYERTDKDGYVLIKVSMDRKMVLKHRHVWEQANGPVPEGYCVAFRDGNRQNCDLSNLFLISREDNARLTLSRETPEQRRARADKAAATLRENDRKDRLRLHWGLPTKQNRIKRW